MATEAYYDKLLEKNQGDIEVVSKNGSITVISWILRDKSELFSKMLQSWTYEGTSKTIEMKQYDIKVIKEFFRYIYTDVYRFVSMTADCYVNLIELSELHQFSDYTNKSISDLKRVLKETVELIPSFVVNLISNQIISTVLIKSLLTYIDSIMFDFTKQRLENKLFRLLDAREDCRGKEDEKICTKLINALRNYGSLYVPIMTHEQKHFVCEECVNLLGGLIQKTEYIDINYDVDIYRPNGNCWNKIRDKVRARFFLTIISPSEITNCSHHTYNRETNAIILYFPKDIVRAYENKSSNVAEMVSNYYKTKVTIVSDLVNHETDCKVTVG